jgi:hypothetical protein
MMQNSASTKSTTKHNKNNKENIIFSSQQVSLGIRKESKCVDAIVVNDFKLIEAIKPEE